MTDTVPSATVMQSGNFGDPEPLWSSREPFPQQSWIDVNTHTHANWVFSRPGIYLVDIQFDAELTTGQAVTARDTLRFAVGDATDPQPAFAMVATAAPEAEAAADRDSARTDARAEESPSTLALVLWGVVGAIVIALGIAILVVVMASRRAKARAIAARQATGAGQ